MRGWAEGLDLLPAGVGATVALAEAADIQALGSAAGIVPLTALRYGLIAPLARVVADLLTPPFEDIDLADLLLDWMDRNESSWRTSLAEWPVDVGE